MSNKNSTTKEHLSDWRRVTVGSTKGEMVQKKNAARRGIDDSEGAVALAGPPRHDSTVRPHHQVHVGGKGTSMDKGHLPPHVVRRGCEDNGEGTETPVSQPSHHFEASDKCGPTHMDMKAKHETKSPPLPEKIAHHAQKFASTESDEYDDSYNQKQASKTLYSKVACTRWTPVDAIVEDTARNDSTLNMDEVDDCYAQPNQKTSDEDKEGYDIEKGTYPSMDEESSDEDKKQREDYDIEKGRYLSMDYAGTDEESSGKDKKHKEDYDIEQCKYPSMDYAGADEDSSGKDKKRKEDYDIEKGKSLSMDDAGADEESTGEEELNEEAALPHNEPRCRPNTTQVHGAVRVLGLDANPFADWAGSDDEESRGQSTAVPELMAELVDREEEEQKFREQMIQDAPFAEVQMDSPYTKRRVLLGGIVFVVLAIAVSVPLGMTLSRKMPTKPLDELLSAVSFDGGEALRTPLTPQNMAYEWLVNNTNLNTYTEKRKIQRYTLATLYFGTNGTSWFDNLNWLDDGDECRRWKTSNGVLVCIGDEEVVELDLLGNNLIGRLPPEIALLSNSLVKLNLDANALSGSIPAEIGQLTAMTSLELSLNELSGFIPTEVGYLTAMRSLSLTGNQITGPIPTEIGLLTGMTDLKLYENTLTGTIPSEISSLTTMSTLYLFSNLLSGTISTEIGLLTAIDGLHLGNNTLTGTIPSEVGSLTAMTGLDLYWNALSGSIPMEVSHLTAMIWLSLHTNQLTGTIPSFFHNMTNLFELYLWDNDFTGSFTCPGFIEVCWISCDAFEDWEEFGYDEYNESCRSL